VTNAKEKTMNADHETQSTRASHNDIDQRISEWHADPRGERLHEALGWTEKEYAAWICSPQAIPDRPLPPRSTL
jgi:hypothetical protein